jgi:predicted secreted Zn-dependent protease
MIRYSVLAVTMWAVATTSFAKTSERSQVVPYPVKGTTAKAIYEDIKKQSPKIAHNATFAFTAIATKTDKTEKASSKDCSYRRFGTSAVYSFVLPKLHSTKGVPDALLSQWQDFAAYLKAHEEWHRDNWRACLKEYDAEALKLSAKDCKSLDKKRESLFTAIKRKCLAADEAFDFSFRKDVRKHPFVAEALGEKPKTGGFVSLFRKKK